MTPSGRFTDPRTRIKFQPGLSHLACSSPSVSLVPLALEYPFWEERTPEALIEFGEVISTDAKEQSKSDWGHELELAHRRPRVLLDVES